MQSFIEYKSYLFLSLLMFLISCGGAEITGNEETIVCNGENVTTNGFYVFSRKLNSNKFGNGDTRSDENARSGKFSALLTKEKPFGMTYIVEHANAGDEFTVAAWRLGANIKGMVVAAEENEGFYFKEGKSLGKDENGWEKLEINFTIPKGMHNISFKVYCWNSGQSPIFFDDLEVSYKVNKEEFIL